MKVILKKTILILSIFIFVVLSGCKQDPVSFENSGLTRGSEMVQLEDVLYYSAKDETNGKFYIVEEKDNSIEKLFETAGFADSLNYDDHALIYCCNDHLCKLDLATGKETTIVEMGPLSNRLQVVDGAAYYLEDQKVYKVDLERKEKTELVDKVYYLTYDIFENDVIYQSVDEEQQFVIKKTNLNDLSQTEIIFNGPALDISAQDDGIYFIKRSIVFPESGDNRLYRLSEDGSCEAVGNQRVLAYNIYGDWIYYSNADDEGAMYRIKEDLSGNQKIFDKEVIVIHAYDGFLICGTRESTGYYTYRLDTNSLEAELFE